MLDAAGLTMERVATPGMLRLEDLAHREGQVSGLCGTSLTCSTSTRRQLKREELLQLARHARQRLWWVVEFHDLPSVGLRQSAGPTQRAAAEAMEWGVSKIIRIEQGAVAITPIDLRALLAAYNVTDDKRVQELVDLARRSKRQSWSEYKEVYSQAALTLFGSEAAARSIYSYEPTFVPGLLQTEEYAQALLAGLGYSEEAVALIVNGRVERQEPLDLDVRPTVSFILGEAVVSRAVGGRRVMSRQLERIKELGTRPAISLQVLPFSPGSHPRWARSHRQLA